MGKVHSRSVIVYIVLDLENGSFIVENHSLLWERFFPIMYMGKIFPHNGNYRVIFLNSGIPNIMGITGITIDITGGFREVRKLQRYYGIYSGITG